MSDIWNPEFMDLSGLFVPIKSPAKKFSQYTQWPSIKEYQTIFKENNIKILPVAQAEKPACFDDAYEPRIFLKSELQTRIQNWHDFFNALVWLRFTKMKKTLNQLHYHAAIKRAQGTNRSALENAITLFDECGCVIISDRDDLLELIRAHRWHELFWQQRAEVKQHMECVVVGHAMYEKALQPYMGMTAHAILISSAELLKQCQQGQYEKLDEFISQLWQQNKINKSQNLQAFPILGMPAWHEANDEENFYLNENYFRAKSLNKNITLKTIQK